MMTTGLEDIVESDKIGLNIGIGIGDGVAHAGLCRKVHNDSRLIPAEKIIDEVTVGDVAPDKLPSCTFGNTLTEFTETKLL